MITRKELIKKYIQFFKKKGHKELPNVSLIPQNDSTVLFNTAGMQPLVPYLLGEKHPLGKRLVNVQKCIRTVDIDEVGDATHHTFFEMLGNWSLGDYFKKEAIEMSFEFLTTILKLPQDKLAVSIFVGDDSAREDLESKKVWRGLGFPSNKIARLDKIDNWWGPAGKIGPCGRDTEMFYWASSEKVPLRFDPNDSTLSSGAHKWVEIWNNVFMEFNKNEEGKYIPLKQKNVDTGMGVERTLAIINGLEDNYLTEVWKPIITVIEHESGKKYGDYKREMRIIADHTKAAVFIIAEGVVPGNTEQGYVLRRLIRRAVMNLRKLGFVGTDLVTSVADSVFGVYGDYKHLRKNRGKIIDEISKEEENFERTLDKGLREFHKISQSKKKISGDKAFLLYQSYGFPLEMTIELAKEKGISVDGEGFEKALKEHQKLSRGSTKGKFSSGLSDNSEKTTALHTATHLLNEALRKVLKDDSIKQKGSNITSERLRFDFNFNRKLTSVEKAKIEQYVNKKIKSNLKIVKEKMSLKKALDSGAQAEFGAKYPNKVTVYTILDPKEKVGWISKEICTGPHVGNTLSMGKFKIKKEESSSAGVRRIKAVLE